MKAVSLQVLFVLRVWCLVTLAGGQPKAPLKCSTECGGFTSAIAARRIRSYRRTEPGCTKQAIIFLTLKHIELCADPEAEWVKKVVEKLEQAKATASFLPHAATSAAGPGELGVFQKHVGVTAPSQATAPPDFFQETGPAVLETAQHPTAWMEMASKFPLAIQGSSELPAGLSPLLPQAAAHSAAPPEANRAPLASPAPSRTVAAGMDSRQLTPHPTALVHGYDSPRGSVPHSPLGSLETTRVPATPETTSFSALNSTAALGKGPSDHPNKAVSSSASPLDSPAPAGDQEPSETPVVPSQGFSGQARVQVSTESPNALPLPGFWSSSQMHFVIPVSVVSGLMACTVAVVWLYLKFGVQTEEMSREMVQGLLYQKEGHITVLPTP